MHHKTVDIHVRHGIAVILLFYNGKSRVSKFFE
jgi:hypothetical protein